eukprot:CAMPEP_0197179482 /NCGR_PEP_ID=MMETSP1423-20130617/4412_1 /TAXON_ID=476441 /ORGANISM="Pseudo-nitzschia heimii, Strain UNC1101" /LENGTH=222 /DNA_ID=CAMNT_0042629393 /DNA_START=201 /DNA_END=870 /DNA_ORIENTATION=-
MMMPLEVPPTGSCARSRRMLDAVRKKERTPYYREEDKTRKLNMVDVTRVSSRAVLGRRVREKKTNGASRAPPFAVATRSRAGSLDSSSFSRHRPRTANRCPSTARNASAGGVAPSRCARGKEPLTRRRRCQAALKGRANRILRVCGVFGGGGGGEPTERPRRFRVRKLRTAKTTLDASTADEKQQRQRLCEMRIKYRSMNPAWRPCVRSLFDKQPGKKLVNF